MYVSMVTKGCYSFRVVEGRVCGWGWGGGVRWQDVNSIIDHYCTLNGELIWAYILHSWSMPLNPCSLWVGMCLLCGPTYQSSAWQRHECLISGSHRVECDGCPWQLVLPKWLMFICGKLIYSNLCSWYSILNWSHGKVPWPSTYVYAHSVHIIIVIYTYIMFLLMTVECETESWWLP